MLRFLAIFVTTASYLVFAVIVGATVVRDATGPLNFTDSGEIILEGFRDCYNLNITTDKTDFTCTEWGLMNSFQVSFVTPILCHTKIILAQHI